MITSFTDEFGFYNKKMKKGTESILIMVMTDKQQKEIFDRWGYTPSKYKLTYDNGCGLAYTDSFKTTSELIVRFKRMNLNEKEIKELMSI